jgi:hypothetical protein
MQHINLTILYETIFSFQFCGVAKMMIMCKKKISRIRL